MDKAEEAKLLFLVAQTAPCGTMACRDFEFFRVTSVKPDEHMDVERYTDTEKSSCRFAAAMFSNGKVPTKYNTVLNGPGYWAYPGFAIGDIGTVQLGSDGKPIASSLTLKPKMFSSVYGRPD